MILDELKENITKRMKKLGYTDDEISLKLESLKDDKKLLSEYKKDLIEKEKQDKALLKERTKYCDNLRDLCVKIKRIFKDDFYIYKSKFVIAGELTKDSLKGEIILIIDDEYCDYFDKVIGNKTTSNLLYVESGDNLKETFIKYIDNYEEVYDICIKENIISYVNDSTFKKIDDYVNTELNNERVDSDGYICVDIDEDDLDIKDMKKKFEMKYKNLPSIEVNSSLFPYLFTKYITKFEFMAKKMMTDKKSNLTIYYARFNIECLYFTIKLKVFYI